MTIKRTATQTCDVGGETRDLSPVNPNPNEGGWRELTKGRHICPECIDMMCASQALDNTSTVE